MKNIQNYREFRLNESVNSFYPRYNYPSRYRERAKELYNLPTNPTVLDKVHNFFQKMETRIDNMAYMGASAQQSRRAERGGGPNTGIESLFGIAAVVPSVLKRIFGPTADAVEKNPENKEEYLKFMRHTNDEFYKNELPKIKSEPQFETHIEDYYKKAGIKRGVNPTVDEVARNKANIFFSKQMNPNSVILQ